MKRSLIYAFVLIGALAFAAVSVSAQETKQKNPSATQQMVQYTCPMHHDYITDKPGKCPKCGMTLVEMKSNKGQQGMMMHQMSDSTHMMHVNMNHDSSGRMNHQMKMMQDSAMMKQHDHKMK